MKYQAIDKSLSYRRAWKVRDSLFIGVVVLPVIASTLYFGFFASNVYLSESKFVVRAPDKPASTGLGIILKSAGFANASDEISAAQSYATSRDALQALNRNGAFEAAYSRPSISVFDRFNPFGTDKSFENLYKYFLNKVGVQNDSTSAITTLSVRAYDPRDAYRINEQLLEMSEATVNHLNQRGREDVLHYAQQDVDNAKAKSQRAAIALAAYRNRSGLVDPEKQAAAQLQMISKLQDQMIAAKTEMAQLQEYAPENPRVPVVRTEMAAIQRQIGEQLGQVAGNRRSLAASGVEYQRLYLENDFAGKQLAAALGSLEEARSEAGRKQAYVERIVQPNFPDSPAEPRRLRGIFATLVLSLIVYGILRMLLAGVREHAQ